MCARVSLYLITLKVCSQPAGIRTRANCQLPRTVLEWLRNKVGTNNAVGVTPYIDVATHPMGASCHEFSAKSLALSRAHYAKSRNKFWTCDCDMAQIQYFLSRMIHFSHVNQLTHCALCRKRLHQKQWICIRFGAMAVLRCDFPGAQWNRRKLRRVLGRARTSFGTGWWMRVSSGIITASVLNRGKTYIIVPWGRVMTLN